MRSLLTIEASRQIGEIPDFALMTFEQARQYMAARLRTGPFSVVANTLGAPYDTSKKDIIQYGEDKVAELMDQAGVANEASVLKMAFTHIWSGLPSQWKMWVKVQPPPTLYDDLLDRLCSFEKCAQEMQDNAGSVSQADNNFVRKFTKGVPLVAGMMPPAVLLNQLSTEGVQEYTADLCNWYLSLAPPVW